jgi:type II restriction enzyme
MAINVNRGEWSEIYIFLKLMHDQRIYAADKNMEKIEDVFLNIIKIIREEVETQVYEYITGDIATVYLNSKPTGVKVPLSIFKEKQDRLFSLMQANSVGNFVLYLNAPQLIVPFLVLLYVAFVYSL